VTRQSIRVEKPDLKSLILICFKRAAVDATQETVRHEVDRLSGGI
jgi:hypothetical protein